MIGIDAKGLVVRAKEQVALDLGCGPGDFDQDVNLFVTQVLREGRRRFTEGTDFFRMACFGKGAVVTAHPCMADWVRGFMGGCEGIRCFDSLGIYRINAELGKHGMCLGYFNDYYLPAVPVSLGLAVGFAMEWHEAQGIPALYADDRFHNALMYREEVLRKDILAVSAVTDGRIAGMAGASEDSREFWQIGIDVLPEFRGQGLATALVGALTEEILKRGKVPYYGTWWSHIASRKVALGSGYQPGWVEMTAVPLKF